MSKYRPWIVVGLGVLASAWLGGAPAAHADPGDREMTLVSHTLLPSDPPPEDDTVVGDLAFQVPAACRAYDEVPARDPRYWDARVSLGACIVVFDDTTAITDAASIKRTLAGLAAHATPALMIYQDVIEHAPDDARYRAAYHVGLVMAAFITRARAALPRDASPKLRAALETQLVEPSRMVREVFAELDRAATDGKVSVADPVNHAMAAAAHAVSRRP